MDKEKLNMMAKQIVPDGFRLESDRSRNAKVILDPNNPSDYKKWKKAPNKTDLKGFDTKKEKEKSTKQVLKSLNVGYIESDPERFVAEGYETRRLIDSVANKIYDRDSMIKALTEVWKSDTSLKSFWQDQEWIGKRDWDALFKTTYIQNLVKKNTIVPLLKQIQKQFNVSEGKAQAIFNKLPQRKKDQLINQQITGIKIPTRRKQPKARPIFDSLPKAKRQKSKKGNYYVRTKPQKWSSMQETFLRNNINQKVDDLVKIYNNTFSTKRTKSSLQTKYYRIKKED